MRVNSATRDDDPDRRRSAACEKVFGTSAQDAFPVEDLNLFLHELRSRRLTAMPPGAEVVLSGGAAGQWYFDWFAERYPSVVKRHIGVEYFSPPPDPLPDGVEWLARTLGDIAPVAEGEVDLVFAGQVIEHLWPDDVVGFLCEANRVLRPGGVVVIDSPTRRITDALGWTHPDHTVELEVDEITELLELAGFDDIDVTGLWLCYDRASARVLPLEVHEGGENWPWQRRVAEAEARPEDSFIWWAEARKGETRADRIAVGKRMHEIYARERPRYFERMKSDFGPPMTDSTGRVVRSPRGRSGLLLHGPSIAMPPGQSLARVSLRAEEGTLVAPGVPVAQLEITRDGGETIADMTLAAADLPSGGAEREVALSFELPDTAFGCEIRLRSTGAASLAARIPVEVDERATDGPTHTIRSLAPDPPSVRARMVLTRLGRGGAWPVRRILDPRLAGLRTHIEWASWNVVQTIDARAAEIGARVDALAEGVASPTINSTPAEREVELPYILAAVGSVGRGSTVLVSDTVGSAPASMLALLGYEIITTTAEAPGEPVAAAVLRMSWLGATDLHRVGSRIRPGGTLVVIAVEGPDRQSVRRLLNRYGNVNVSVSAVGRRGDASLVLGRASISET